MLLINSKMNSETRTTPEEERGHAHGAVDIKPKPLLKQYPGNW